MSEESQLILMSGPGWPPWFTKMVRDLVKAKIIIERILEFNLKLLTGQYCGATLISDNHVLTAAHCLKPFRREDIMIKLGEYDFNEDGETGDETFSVAAMKLHENYNEQTYENDIAIMRLDRPATFSKSIWPICLPDNSRDFTNTRAFVIGNNKEESQK